MRLITLALLTSLMLGGASSRVDHQTEPPKAERYNWKSVQIGAGGFITGIVFHPAEKGLAYVRTDIGGAYRLDHDLQGNAHWVPLLDWLTKPDWNLYGVESIALDPRDPKKLYLACGTYLDAGNGAILRSNDQGRSFLRTDLPFKLGGNQDGRSIGERLAVDPIDGQTLYLGSRKRGLWRSTDGAKSWAEVAGAWPPEIGAVAFMPSPGDRDVTETIFVGAVSRDHPIYASVDRGKNWSPVAGQPTGLIPHQLKVSGPNLYVTYGNNPGPNGMTDGAVYRYANGVWTDITPIHPNSGNEKGFGYAGLAIDPKAPKTVLVTTLDRWNPGDDVFRSTDAGQTWEGQKAKSTMDATLAPYMTFGDPQPKFGWWMGSLALDPFKPGHVLYGTGANIWENDDVTKPQLTWRLGSAGIEETAVIDLLSPLVGAHLISALGDIGGFTHLDLDHSPPGMTLNPILSNTDCIDEAEQAPLVAVRAGRGRREKPAGGFSVDGGKTWATFPTAPVPGRQSGSVTVTGDGTTFIWAPERSAPYYSADQAILWSPCQGLPATGNYQVVADRGRPSWVYAISPGRVFRSQDDGVHFAPVTAAGLPERFDRARAVPGHGGELWLPSPSGLFVSTDGAESFVHVESVERADCIGFGKAAPTKGGNAHAFPAIYLSGKVAGVEGAFRSDDRAETWVRISDPQHEYGTQDHITGDPRIYGRVYIGTNGRGVLYGDPTK
jgi:photosystem II stability/assembly factor-like uncharacterized protein